MPEFSITLEDVRGAVVLAMEGFWHPNAGAEFDAWLAEHDREVAANALREAAQLMRPGGSRQDYWDGERVSWVEFEESPNRNHPRDILLREAERIVARTSADVPTGGDHA